MSDSSPSGADIRERREAIVREHFDQLTIMQQLALAHETTSLPGRLSTLVSHPVTIARALLSARRRS